MFAFDRSVKTSAIGRRRETSSTGEAVFRILEADILILLEYYRTSIVGLARAIPDCIEHGYTGIVDVIVGIEKHHIIGFACIAAGERIEHIKRVVDRVRIEFHIDGDEEIALSLDRACVKACAELAGKCGVG